MTRAGGPRPEVRALLEPVLPYLGAARRTCSADPSALVLVGPGRDPTVLEPHGISWEMAPAGRGETVHVAAAALERVASLAREYAPTVAHHLGADPGEGATWCLVLATDGVAVHAIRWPDAPAAPPPHMLN